MVRRRSISNIVLLDRLLSEQDQIHRLYNWDWNKKEIKFCVFRRRDNYVMSLILNISINSKTKSRIKNGFGICS